MVRYFAAVLVVAGACWAAADERRFEHTNEQFAITLTSDWKEVNPKAAPYAKDVLTTEDDVVTRAYQFTSDTNFAAAIFVEIDQAYRIPERDVAMLQHDRPRQTFLTQALEPEGLRMLDSTFSTNRLEVRISATADYPKTGKTRQLIGWFLTDKGSYSVTCVAPAEHYKAVSEVFVKALDTFYVDPALAYRPRSKVAQELASETKTTRVKFRLGWVFGLAFVVLLVARRFTRVNSDEV